jgi:hypothetical protein
MADPLEELGSYFSPLLRRAGDYINAYPSAVATAFQPQGLIGDLLGFAGENIQKYGQRTADYHANLSKAFSDIQSGNTPPDLGPLIQDAMSVNPTMAGTWGPIRTGAQKKAVSALWRADPEAVKAIATDPRELRFSGLVDIPNREDLIRFQKSLTSQGWIPDTAAATYTPSRDVIKIAPSTMRGSALFPPEKTPGITILGSGMTPESYSINAVNLPEVMKHEAQHFLNVPRLYPEGSAPNTAATIAMHDKMLDQLSPYLGAHAQTAAMTGSMMNLDPRVATDEALAYLSMPGARNPAKRDVGGILHDLLKVRPGLEQGTTRGIAITPETIESAIAKAEAIHAMSPENKVASNPFLRDMVARLRDQFNILRGQQGGAIDLPEKSATFSKFKSDKPGGQLIDEYYKRYADERMRDVQGMLDNARQKGRPDVEQIALERLQPPPKDEFIRDMVEWIGRGLDYPNDFSPGARGLAGIRRTMLGKDVRYDPDWANKPMNQLDSPPIPSSDLVSILHHLDRNGLLTTENLSRRTGLGGEVRGRPGSLNPTQVNKLQRFLDETAYEPLQTLRQGRK